MALLLNITGGNSDNSLKKVCYKIFMHDNTNLMNKFNRK